jgi:glutathione S-transferase
LVVKPKVLNIEPNLTLVEQAKNNELPPMLDYLENSVKQFDWIAGNEFYMADIAIAVQLLALQITGFALSNARWPQLNFYLAKITDRPSFQKVISK